MTLIKQVSVQEKIAELEQRIEKLEGKRPRPSEPISPKAQKHWNTMWKEFDDFWQELFK